MYLGSPNPKVLTHCWFAKRGSTVDVVCKSFQGTSSRVLGAWKPASTWGAVSMFAPPRSSPRDPPGGRVTKVTLAGGFDLIDGQAGHQMVQLLLFAGVGVLFGHGV